MAVGPIVFSEIRFPILPEGDLIRGGSGAMGLERKKSGSGFPRRICRVGGTIHRRRTGSDHLLPDFFLSKVGPTAIL